MRESGGESPVRGWRYNIFTCHELGEGILVVMSPWSVPQDEVEKLSFKGTQRIRSPNSITGSLESGKENDKRKLKD